MEKMDIRKITILLLVFLAIYSTGYAGKKVEEIKIKRATGTAVVTNSIESARELALKNAKLDAFKQAGISESMQVFTDYFKGEGGNKYDELFSSNAMSQISGSIKSVNILNKEKSMTENGEFKIRIDISCIVLKHNTEPDPSFNFEISGMDGHYKDGTGLKFIIKPTKNAYLNVFVFSESEDYQLYPNDYEDSKELKKDEKQHFPVSGIKYTNTCKNEKENNRVVFVMTKNEIAFTGNVSHVSVIDWINSIPLDERCVKSQTYLVTE